MGALAVKEAVDGLGITQDVQSLKEKIEDALAAVDGNDEDLRTLKGRVEKILKEVTSPWDALKKHGLARVPVSVLHTCRDVVQSCCRMGLWIVPVGELEGFCLSIGGHGPKWTRVVIGTRDLADDPELCAARKFMTDIWEASHGI